MTTGFPALEALIPRLESIPTLDAAALDAEEIAILGRKSTPAEAAFLQKPGSSF